MKTLLFIGMGGAMGAILRFSVTELMARLLGRGFPYGTLTVNLTGSLLMGVMFVLVQHSIVNPHSWRPFVMVGMLGALTTFSSFSMDTVLLLEQGNLIKAFLNVSLNVICCIMLAYLAMQLTNNMLASR
ncbi:fluoride efflux transporter CrcB [Zobellella aerophila]|uniref:Fluoride-specific ion channel FluC n=1 Tax=Zobellella aerophila TaxID=870480 RepID=A0ABP6WBL7_9GAMM